MNKKELNIVLEILDLSLKYGIPYVKEAIKNNKKEIITQEDIDELKIENEWGDYFDE